jgi:hypothetical protein
MAQDLLPKIFLVLFFILFYKPHDCFICLGKDPDTVNYSIYQLHRCQGTYATLVQASTNSLHIFEPTKNRELSANEIDAFLKYDPESDYELADSIYTQREGSQASSSWGGVNDSLESDLF